MRVLTKIGLLTTIGTLTALAIHSPVASSVMFSVSVSVIGGCVVAGCLMAPHAIRQVYRGNPRNQRGETGYMIIFPLIGLAAFVMVANILWLGWHVSQGGSPAHLVEAMMSSMSLRWFNGGCAAVACAVGVWLG